MPRITVIPPERAEGRLKDVYDEMVRKRGAIANVHAIHSLQPETMRTHIDFYLSVVYGRSGLSRHEREAIAVAVSAANRCDYCVRHHAEALARYQKDATVVAGLSQGKDPPGLGARERAIVTYARRLTERPGEVDDAAVQALRDAGLDDEQVLMATLTAAYFNFVNRVVLALGVQPEGQRQDYKY